jgi:glycosyltransferase involved in cell wall biosynthesis
MLDISVIIPCHNQGAFLRECVDSVLAQTLAPKEIIIVDDGSSCPLTAGVLRAMAPHPKIRILSNSPAEGLPAARNRGISANTASHVLPLDADDKIAANYLEWVMDALSKNPGIGLVCGDGHYFGKRVGPTAFPRFSHARMLLDNCIFSAAVFRKSDWERAGGYKTQFREGWEDWDFYMTLLENGAVYHHIDKLVYYYRRHSHNMTAAIDKNPGRKNKLYAMLLERHPAFIQRHAGEALMLYFMDRSRQRAFNQHPLVASCRRLLRLFRQYP